jgi:hypothetical protein
MRVVIVVLLLVVVLVLDSSPSERSEVPIPNPESLDARFRKDVGPPKHSGLGC